MWQSLGFRDSPYNTDPLFVRSEDVELLVGRQDDAIGLFTKLDSSNHGTLTLSGPPGVGKTSFLNVQQYLLETGGATFGPRLLAARTICAVRPDDTASELALRALDSLFRSVDAFCIQMGHPVPSETRKLGEWLNNRGGTGFDLGVTIAGFGGNVARQVHLPSVRDASFESITDAIRIIVSEVVAKLGLEGVIIALDNIENLQLDSLKTILISFRDTLFSTNNTWWILIGQRGLASIVQALDARVSQRMAGGIDMQPITIDELNTAIEIRANLFRYGSGHRPPPIPKSIHDILFGASHGGMRFLFNYCEKICVRFVEMHRKAVIRQLEGTGSGATRESIERLLSVNIGDDLTDDQIGHEAAISILTTIVREEIEMLGLDAGALALLALLGNHLGCQEAELATNVDCNATELAGQLENLLSNSLVNREPDPDNPDSTVYRLCDTAKLAFDLEIL